MACQSSMSQVANPAPACRCRVRRALHRAAPRVCLPVQSLIGPEWLAALNTVARQRRAAIPAVKPQWQSVQCAGSVSQLAEPLPVIARSGRNLPTASLKGQNQDQDSENDKNDGSNREISGADSGSTVATSDLFLRFRRPRA